MGKMMINQWIWRYPIFRQTQMLYCPPNNHGENATLVDVVPLSLVLFKLPYEKPWEHHVVLRGRLIPDIIEWDLDFTNKKHQVISISKGKSTGKWFYERGLLYVSS